MRVHRAVSSTLAPALPGTCKLGQEESFQAFYFLGTFALFALDCFAPGMKVGSPFPAIKVSFSRRTKNWRGKDEE